MNDTPFNRRHLPQATSRSLQLCHTSVMPMPAGARDRPHSSTSSAAGLPSERLPIADDGALLPSGVQYTAQEGSTTIAISAAAVQESRRAALLHECSLNRSAHRRFRPEEKIEQSLLAGSTDCYDGMSAAVSCVTSPCKTAERLRQLLLTTTDDDRSKRGYLA